MKLKEELDDAPPHYFKTSEWEKWCHSHDAAYGRVPPVLLQAAWPASDKEGVIVDFGGHLRASIPETREKIDLYLK